MATLNCPACSGTLHPLKWYSLVLDICSSCDGIWFDFGEMVLVADSDSLDNIDRKLAGEYQEPFREEMRRQLEIEKPRCCPKDGTPLERHEWDGDAKIILDYCPGCSGTWMDAGEFEGYVAAQKKWEKKPPKASDEVVEEIRRQNEQMDREINEWVLKQDIGFFDGLGDVVWKCRMSLESRRKDKAWYNRR